MAELRNLVGNKHNTAVFNFFQVADCINCATRGAPMHKDDVQRLKGHFWFPRDICPIHDRCGDLVHIFLWQAAAPVDDTAPSRIRILFAMEDEINTCATDGELETFRRLALSCAVRVELQDNQQAHFCGGRTH